MRNDICCDHVLLVGFYTESSKCTSLCKGAVSVYCINICAIILALRHKHNPYKGFILALKIAASLPSIVKFRDNTGAR